MVLRTAGRGRYEGQQFWGCSTYPNCRAVIDIKGQQFAPGASEPMQENAAGASAQARYERERKRQADRARSRWPLLVGLTLIVMFIVYLAGAALGQPGIGVFAASGVAILFLLVYFERSRDAEAWFRGAEGERKTAAHLAGLEEAGFIVRHDRRVPGYGGNVDHIAVGPTGVWVVETKSYRGGVEVFGDRLEVNGQPRDRIVDQVYKEAVSVQIALGDRLTMVGVTVTPVLCLHRAKLGWFDKSVRGVRIVDGRGLAKLLRQGERRLDDDAIESIARELDRLLPPAVSG
jgi:hypothetical protein